MHLNHIRFIDRNDYVVIVTMVYLSSAHFVFLRVLTATVKYSKSSTWVKNP